MDSSASDRSPFVLKTNISYATIYYSLNCTTYQWTYWFFHVVAVSKPRCTFSYAFIISGDIWNMQIQQLWNNNKRRLRPTCLKIVFKVHGSIQKLESNQIRLHILYYKLNALFRDEHGRYKGPRVISTACWLSSCDAMSGTVRIFVLFFFHSFIIFYFVCFFGIYTGNVNFASTRFDSQFHF